MLTNTIPKSPRLIALHLERARLRAELTDSVSALDRAERNVEAWRQQHTAAVEAATVQESDHCAHLAALIASDSASAITPLEPDGAAATQLAYAQLNLSVAQKAQSALESAHQSTRDKLAALDAGIATEADSLLDARREALAERVQQSWGQFVNAVGALRELTPDHLHTSVNIARQEISPRVAAALAQMPMEDGINTPINSLRGGFESAAALCAVRSALIEDASV